MTKSTKRRPWPVCSWQLPLSWWATSVTPTAVNTTRASRESTQARHKFDAADTSWLPPHFQRPPTCSNQSQLGLKGCLGSGLAVMLLIVPFFLGGVPQRGTVRSDVAPAANDTQGVCSVPTAGQCPSLPPCFDATIELYGDFIKYKGRTPGQANSNARRDNATYTTVSSSASSRLSPSQAASEANANAPRQDSTYTNVCQPSSSRLSSSSAAPEPMAGTSTDPRNCTLLAAWCTVVLRSNGLSAPTERRKLVLDRRDRPAARGSEEHRFALSGPSRVRSELSLARGVTFNRQRSGLSPAAAAGMATDAVVRRSAVRRGLPRELIADGRGYRSRVRVHTIVDADARSERSMHT
jgi:hypothetical protein